MPPYCITAETIPPYFGFTASAKAVTAEKWKNAYPQKIAAVLHYRRKPPYFGFTASAKKYRQKRENRQPPKNYRRMAIPPRLCPPKKPLPTTTLLIMMAYIYSNSYLVPGTRVHLFYHSVGILRPQKIYLFSHGRTDKYRSRSTAV